CGHPQLIHPNPRELPMKTICSLVTKAPRLAPLCLLALLIGGVTVVQAQSNERVQVGGYIMILAPRGEFSQNVTNNGYGGGGQVLIRVGSSPFLIGGDLSGVNYGSQSRREPISSTIPNLAVGVTTNNNIFLTHFVLRAQPRSGRVR